MAVRMIYFRRQASRIAPGLPFVAWSGPFEPTVPHRIDFVEIMVVTEGEGKRIIIAPDGTPRTTRLLPGQLHMFRPSDVQEIHGVGPIGMSALGVAFPYDTWEAFAKLGEVDRGLFVATSPPMAEADPKDVDVVKPFQRMLTRYAEGPTAMDLVEFLAVTIPRFGSPTGERAPSWLWTAIGAMHEESNLRAGVSRFSELSHVSAAHLWRSTNRYFGVSPSDLVNEIRLGHAATLLKSTDVSIRLIAERCGFWDASHFSKIFRRNMSLTPREFRSKSLGARPEAV